MCGLPMMLPLAESESQHEGRKRERKEEREEEKMGKIVRINSIKSCGEDSVHFESFTLKWTEWFEIIPSTFKVDPMVLKTIPPTSKVLLSVHQAGHFSA